MLEAILDRIATYCEDDATRQTLDRRVVAPLLGFVWDRYRTHFAVMRNVFFAIGAILVLQVALNVLMYRRLCRLCHVAPTPLGM